MKAPHYDVAIMGAGVIGASIAYHLVRAGVKRIVLIERSNVPGQGSTTKAPAGFRHQFSTAINVQLSQESIARLDTLGDETGHPFVFHQEGYLLVAATPADWQQLQTNIALQRSLGVPVQQLTPASVQDRVPLLRTEGVLGGAFCALDGHGDPAQLLAALLQGARSQGVELRLGTTVTGIRQTGERITGLETNGGHIAAPVVICTAGAWSGQLGSWIGQTIPIRPSQRTLWMTEPLPETPPTLPFVVDLEEGFLFVRRGQRIIFGMPGRPVPPDAPSFQPEPQHALLPRVLEQARRRAPFLTRAPIATAWAGLYEMTPDAQPIVDAVPGLSGLYLAAGFSGHGVMHALAIGRILSDWITRGGVADIDLSPLSLARFQGQAAAERMVF